MVRVFGKLVSQLPWKYLRKTALLAAVLTVVFIGFATWQTSTNDAEVMFELLMSSQYRVRLDPSRRFAISEYAIVGENWKAPSRVPSPCLATQASVSHLQHLLHLAQRWQGMMSVAVLVPDIDFQWAVLHIQNLMRCHPHLMANVSIHFVYPVAYPPVISSSCTPLDVDDCSEKNLDISNSDGFNASAILYPQNLMRNVASGSCLTENVIVTDIDMIPSAGLASQLDTFLRTNESHCSKCVYVIPAYEINENATVPNNKSELLDLVYRKLARPYRQAAYKANQGATNANRWQEISDGGPISIAYRLTCFKFGYEPFYLAGGPVPPFDLRFEGYGYTRNTQAYETQLTGFRFFVLNNVFLVQHKMVDSPFASPGRMKQVENNTVLFRNLERELRVKYEKLSKLPCASPP